MENTLDMTMEPVSDFEAFGITAQSRLLILAPHPDDEALATGALVQRAHALGARVNVVFLTDGENNPWPQRVADRCWRIGPRERARWGARRRGEALRSLRNLGVEPDRASFLGFDDQRLTERLITGDHDLFRVLGEVFAERVPTHVFSPSAQDHHSDHSATAIAVRTVGARRGRHHTPRLFEYIVHDGTQRQAGKAVCLNPAPEEIENKRNAIACHVSQLFFRRAELLGFASHREVFFESAPAGSDEADHPIRCLRVDSDFLRCSFRREPCLRACGAATLMLLYPNLHGMRRCLSIRLPWRSSRVPISFANGRTCPQPAVYSGGPYRGELAVPIAVLPRLLPGFAKIEARFGFFDEAGWRSLPMLSIADGQALRVRLRRHDAASPAHRT